MLAEPTEMPLVSWNLLAQFLPSDFEVTGNSTPVFVCVRSGLSYISMYSNTSCRVAIPCGAVGEGVRHWDSRANYIVGFSGCRALR